jgi:outer membrane receptor for ferrienterochelin and colicins
MRLGITLLFISLSVFSVAQEQVDSVALKSIDEVVVTATRSPRLLGNVAIPASIISSKTLYQSGSLRLHDILSEQTGIMVVDNFGKGIQVQGLSSEYTLILLDGEPLIGRTGGVFDLSRLTIRNIVKIEIIKGPSSSLYGSEAMGGVVNIITDRAGQHKTDANLRYAKFNTVDGSFNFSRRLNKTDIQGGFNYNRSEGYSLKPNSIQQTVEPYWRSTQHVNVNHKLNEKWKMGVGYRHNNTDIKNEIAVQNGSAIIISNGFERTNEYNITPHLQHRFSPRLTTTIRGYLTGFKAVQELSVKETEGGYDDRFKQDFRRIENQTDWQIREQSSFNAGAGIIDESVSSNRYDSLSTKRQNSIAYFFLQHEEKLNKKLTIIGGFRFDANKAYSSVWSPKAALQYRLSDNVSINLSYGRGFKAPDFRQLYLNFTNLAAGSYSVFGAQVALQELKRMQDAQLIQETTSLAGRVGRLNPEVSGGINAGIKFKIATALKGSVNLFRNDLTNMILTDVIAYKKNGGQIFSYFNINRALTQGVEVDLEKNITKTITAKAGYQFLYTADKDALANIRKGSVFQRDLQSGQVYRMTIADYGGLPNRSRHNANLKLSYEHASGMFATTRLIYRSRWGTTDLDGNGLINRSDEYASGYLQLNMSAGFSINKKCRIMGGVDNVLNYKDIQFLPGNPGRVGYLDIQVNF